MGRELPKIESRDLIYAKKINSEHNFINRVLKLKDEGDSFKSAFNRVLKTVGELGSKKAEEILYRIAEKSWEQKKVSQKSGFTPKQLKRMKRGAELQQLNEEKRAGQTYHESDFE